MVFCCFYRCCVCDFGMRQRLREFRLLKAAKRGDGSVVGRLVIELRVNPNCRYFKSGRGVLHMAAKYGRSEHLRLMIHYGCRVDKRDRKGKSALHFAAEFGQLEACRVLLEFEETDVDAKTLDRVVPLHLAAANGHTVVAKFLLEQGANPLAKDKRHYTPQTYAYDRDHMELYKYLHSFETTKAKAWGLK